MANCRTCSKYSELKECLSIELKISENKSILDLIKEWASIKEDDSDKLPQVICKICFSSVTSFVSFINLIRKSDQEFKKRFESGNDPELLSEDPKNVALEELKCGKCYKKFQSADQYKNHISKHDRTRSYSCETCGKSFAKNYILMYHTRVHTGEKKFNCDFCNKSFIHPSNLYKHKKIHTNTRNYKCEFCSKCFIQSEALKVHIRRIHTGEKPFLCEHCSKPFASQSALHLHLQDTHLQKKPCPFCQKLFSNRLLKRHIDWHKNMETVMKKFICEQCGRMFSSDHNLKKHLLAHNGIKPYASQPLPCPICKKMYSKRRLKSHICLA